ncbi:MAG: hypothetical protein AAFN74_09775, partial [Myxococcota bacterium]
MSARKPPNNGRRQREQPLDGRPSRRLMGLETEYAIRYGGAPRPRHDHIYDDLIAVLRDETEVYDGDRRIAN